jgi:predicted membrane-bound dolichyl-phosphate-mannose-protein mannosyltransferase
MKDNHKIFGMKSNVAYGVCFIIPFVAVFALILDRGMNRENRVFMWEAVIGWAIAIILGAITYKLGCALGWVIYAIMIFIGVINLLGNETHLPFISVLAEKLVK